MGDMGTELGGWEECCSEAHSLSVVFHWGEPKIIGLLDSRTAGRVLLCPDPALLVSACPWSFHCPMPRSTGVGLPCRLVKALMFLPACPEAPQL